MSRGEKARRTFRQLERLVRQQLRIALRKVMTVSINEIIAEKQCV
jgi:hypothetical protein